MNSIADGNSPLTSNDCIICLEPLKPYNISVTKCGHKFCFSCIANSLQYKNTCPYCREELVQIREDVEDEDEYESENEYENDILIEEGPQGSVDDIAKELENEGITMVDVLSYFMNRWNSSGSNYSYRADIGLYRMEYVESTINSVIEEVDTKLFERLKQEEEGHLFREEDHRRNEDIRKQMERYIV